MPAFLTDENFKHAILRGLLRHRPDLDIVRVQQVGLRTADDATILAWAAEQGRVLLTHDARTIAIPAYDRVRNGEKMSGVVVVSATLPVGAAIRGILGLLQQVPDAAWDGLVYYLATSGQA